MDVSDPLVAPAWIALIRRSLVDRQPLCEVLLALCRVELTRILARIASDGSVDVELELLEALASSVMLIASAARFAEVHGSALELRERTSAARRGGELEERDMLASGLQLIDRILESGRPVEPSATADLN